MSIDVDYTKHPTVNRVLQENYFEPSCLRSTIAVDQVN